MPPPDAPAQVGASLAVAKRQAVSFDIAWRAAIRAVRWPQLTVTRRSDKAALTEMRWAFELGYRGEEVPGGAAVVALLAMVRDEPGGGRSDTPAASIGDMAPPPAISSARVTEAA